MICEYCGKEITRCDECDSEFEEGEEIICWYGFRGVFLADRKDHLHFCSEECLKEFLHSEAEFDWSKCVEIKFRIKGIPKEHKANDEFNKFMQKKINKDGGI